MRRVFYAVLPNVLSMVFNCQACLFQLHWYQLQVILLGQQLKETFQQIIPFTSASN
jgi:hypothetical protein